MIGEVMQSNMKQPPRNIDAFLARNYPDYMS